MKRFLLLPALTAALLFLPALRQDDPVIRLENLRERTDDASRKEAADIVAKEIPLLMEAGIQARNRGDLKTFEKNFFDAARLFSACSPKEAEALVRVVHCLRRETRIRLETDLRAIGKAFRDGDAGAGGRLDALYDTPLFENVLQRSKADLDKWGFEPPSEIAVDGMIRTLSLRLSTFGDCAPCSGNGECACEPCKSAGTVEADCYRCKAAGQIECGMCEGTGKIDHHSYAGWLVIDIKRDTKIRFKTDKGKWVRGTLRKAKIRYTMSDCSGRGSWNLDTSSTDGKRISTTQTCTKLWEEFDRCIFSGKADILVPDSEGNEKRYSREAARRLLTSYQECDNGKVTCDGCTGGKTVGCTVCAGMKKVPGACDPCLGSGLTPCNTCRGFGKTKDVSWLSRLLPAEVIEGMKSKLDIHAEVLNQWVDERIRLGLNRRRALLILERAKKLQNPKAELEEDYVRLPCPKCRGRGRDCGSCWGTGTRDYYSGTPQFEPYGMAARIENRLADYDPEKMGPPPALGDALIVEGPAKEEDLRETWNFKKKIPPAPDEKDLPVTPMPLAELPEDVQLEIRRAVACKKKGDEAFSKSDSSSNPDGWVEASHEAIGWFRRAQTHYATAQETLDERGIEVPQALMDAFRENMQSLFWARKHAP